jgi:hypothetical protein
VTWLFGALVLIALPGLLRFAHPPDVMAATCGWGYTISFSFS